MTWARLSFATGLVLLSVWFDLIPALRGPSANPEEWRWLYRESAPTRVPWAALASACAVVALLFASGREAGRRLSPRALLGASALLGAVLQVSLLGAVGDRSGLGFMIHRVMNPGFTSYYTVAVSAEAEDVRDLLAHYAERMAVFETSAPHAGTKPPGAVLAYRTLFALCEAMPALTRGVVGFATSLDPALAARTNQRGGAAGLAAAALGALLTLILGIGVCVPVVALARALGAGPLEAARVGALWCVLPGPTLMTPVLDQTIAFFVAGSAGLFALGVTRERGAAHASFAGVLAAVALLLSYGSAVFIATGVVVGVALGMPRCDAAALRRVLPLLVLFAGEALAILVLSAVFGFAHVENFAAAMALHLERYTEPRSYRAWLLWNPWDLALFVGFPVMLLFARHAASGGAAILRAPHWPGDPLARVRGSLGVCLLLLMLSGAVRGEVGRLLIPLMPLLLTVALVRRERGPGAVDAGVLAALLLATDVVLRVSWRLP